MMTIRITTKKSEIRFKLPLKFSGSSFFIHKRMNKYLFIIFQSVLFDLAIQTKENFFQKAEAATKNVRLRLFVMRCFDR